MKAEVDKLDIDELANLPIIVNNLKAKVDDLDVGKLKTVLVDLKNYVMQWMMKLLKTQNLLNFTKNKKQVI